jgi:hypothetical protein
MAGFCLEFGPDSLRSYSKLGVVEERAYAGLLLVEGDPIVKYSADSGS